MSHVWVVEMWNNGKFIPTVGVGLGREQGKRELEIWKEHNPDDKFRLVKYVGVK